MRFFIKKLTISLIVSVLIYFNLQYWQVGFFGLLLIAYSLLLNSVVVRPILTQIFNFSDDTLRTKLFSVLLSFYTLGLIGGAFILLTSFNDLIISLVFLLNTIFWILLKIILIKEMEDEGDIFSVFKQGIAYAQEPKSKLSVLIYLILVAFGFSLLYHSQTAQSIFSPWQTIDHLYIYIFFVATLILGFLLFSKLSSKFLLFLLIIHSFLLHAYLPLTHQFFYGADQWRLLGAENQVLQNQPLNIVLHDTQPESLVRALNPGKLAYSQLWSVKVILSKNLNLNLITLDKWLSMILFAGFVPLLFYQLSRLLNFNKRKSLLFVYLSFLLFPSQSLGSLTLPVSFGFIFFCLIFLLLLQRLRQPNWKQLIVLLPLFLLSLFGYSLYLILFFVILVITEVVIKLQATSYKLQEKYGLIAGVIIYILLVCFTALFIPALEYFSRYSYVDLSVNWFEQIKQFIGNLISIYLAWGPRPHDILGGNLIFNQIPNYAFVANIFTTLRYWLPIFMLGFWAIFVYGLFKVTIKKSVEYTIISVLTIGFWINYFVGFYLLSGGKNISRRLDMVLSTLTLVALFYGLNKLFFRQEYTYRKSWLVIIIFAIAITASYSLGPDMKAVSVNEYQASVVIWNEVKNDKKYCVIADTYTLLPLEYFSARKIEGGGFPMSWDFGQPERIEVLKAMQANPSIDILQKALVYIGADKCYYISSKEISVAGIKEIGKYGNFIVYEYNKLRTKN